MLQRFVKYCDDKTSSRCTEKILVRADVDEEIGRCDDGMWAAPSRTASRLVSLLESNQSTYMIHPAAGVERIWIQFASLQRMESPRYNYFQMRVVIVNICLKTRTAHKVIKGYIEVPRKKDASASAASSSSLSSYGE